MSETPFPVPRTTAFIPDAWDETEPVPQEEISFLDNYFVRFPNAQSTPITFPVNPTVLTLPIGTSDNRAASTQFVQNAKNTRTWGALQTFNAGMVTNAIDPTTTGGTLLIGNGATTNNIEVATSASRSVVLHLGDGNNSTGAVHIGNGTSSSGNVQILNGAGSTGTINLGSATSTTNLGVPLSPTYTYPVASGKIGFILTGTFADVPNLVVNTDYQLASLSIPAGVWIIQGSCGLTSMIQNSNALIGINTSASTTGARARQMYSYANFASNVMFSTNFITSLSTTTTHYFMAINSQAVSPAYSWNNITFQATRIA